MALAVTGLVIENTRKMLSGASGSPPLLSAR